jgi:4-hydroxybenzoate polyprenyltransferase
MITRSTILHLRLPFSYFLLPVYLLALLATNSIDPLKAGIVFFVLHFLLYPAANGFNSFCDRDQESIGMLECPPPVTPDLARVTFAMNAMAILVALSIGYLFVLGCLLYILAEKAYSWDRIRIKKYPVLGWLFTGCGQGTFIFLLVVSSVQKASFPVSSYINAMVPALASGLFMLGFYPLTQIYQHREDAKKGCETISLCLGVRKTIYFSSIFIFTAMLLYYQFLEACFGIEYAWLFLVIIIPAGLYFVYWFILIMKDETRADYKHTMRMCFLSASSVNIFALGVLLAGINK